MIQDAQKRAQEAVEKYGKVYSDDDFQKMIKDQFGKDAFTDGSVAYGFDGSDFPEFKDLTTNFKFNFSDDVFFNEAKSKLSPKELKKMEKKRKQLQEKQKELMEEQKKLQEKQRELNKEMRQNNPWTISFNSNLDSPTKIVFVDSPKIYASNKTFVLNKTASSSNLDNTTIYIDGKQVEKSELQKLDPSVISSMSIFKTNGTGKIEVITK